MKERRKEWPSIRLIAKFSRESSVSRRRVDSHQRRERRRGPETDQRHDWKRTLASLHSLWELRNFPDGRRPCSNSLIRTAPCSLFSKYSCCFAGFEIRGTKLFRQNVTDYMRVRSNHFRDEAGLCLIERRILLKTSYHDIIRELLKEESNYISYTMSWNNMKIYNINYGSYRLIKDFYKFHNYNRALILVISRMDLIIYGR